MDERQLSSNNKTLSLHGVRPMSKDGDLCTECEAIFQQLGWPELSPVDPPSETGHNRVHDLFLGWLDRLAASTSCAMCQFLVRLFFSSSEAFPMSGLTHRRRFLCRLRAENSVFEQTGVLLDWRVDVNFTDIWLSTSANDRPPEWKQKWQYPGFRLMHESARKLVHDPLGYPEATQVRNLAFPVAEICSAEFIRESYNTCLQHHGIQCNVSKRVLRTAEHASIDDNNRAFPTMVLDVIDRRIIRAPPDCRYVALSYCWAEDRYLVLDSSNASLLEQKNSFELDQLSPTIADAAKVVQIMGERYLWVDCLCILQDNAEMKKVEIEAMNVIYRYAVLTIVAAKPQATTRDQGLPGMRSGNRPIKQDVVQVRGLEFAADMRDLWTLIRSCHWYTRFWTYQEHFLSKRELIFSEYQAFFSCASDAFAEDHVETACMHHNETTLPAPPCCQYKTPDSFDGRTVVNEGSVVSYEVLARDISKRNLTFESDALNAITGILTAMKEESDVSFLCGLPVAHLLDHFVFWIPQSYIRRRGPNSAGLRFPSWSWLGWVGPVVYPIVGEDFDGEMKFSHESYVEQPTILIPASSGGLFESKLNGVRYKTTTIGDLGMEQSEGAVLRFTAPRATITVSHLTWGTFPECEGFSSRCHAVIVQESCAGLVIFNRDHDIGSSLDLEGYTMHEAWKISAGEGEKCEVLALATECRAWAPYFPVRPDPNSDANYYILDDDEDPVSSHVPYDADKWEDSSCDMIKIMVIEWKEEVAFRRGVGQIHPDAWEEIGYSLKDINLG